MKDDITTNPEAVLATTLVLLAGSTALLGAALWLTGKMQLAGMVQYLPMPVVGGYLAFIGLYCLEAGVSTMTNEDVETIPGEHQTKREIACACASVRESA